MPNMSPSARTRRWRACRRASILSLPPPCREQVPPHSQSSNHPRRSAVRPCCRWASAPSQPNSLPTRARTSSPSPAPAPTTACVPMARRRRSTHTAVSVPDAVERTHPDGIDILIDLANDGDDFAALASLVRRGGTAVTTRYAADTEELASRGVTGLNFRLEVSSSRSSARGSHNAASFIAPENEPRYAPSDDGQAHRRPSGRGSLRTAPRAWSPPLSLGARKQKTVPRQPTRPHLVPNERLAGTAGDARIRGRAGAESRKRIRERDIAHWARPGAVQARRDQHQPRRPGVYFNDPAGRQFELITTPYA